MTSTELTPLIQAHDPYTALTYKEMTPPPPERVIVHCPECIGIFPRWLRGQEVSTTEKAELCFGIASIGIVTALFATMGCMCACSAGAGSASLGLIASGGGCTLCASVPACASRYYWRQQTRGIRERFQAILREAGGDKKARVEDRHIRDFFANIQPEQYPKLDFEHTVAIYTNDGLRNLFVANIAYLNPPLESFWRQVVSIHQLSVEHFKNIWLNPSFQEELSLKPDLKEIVINYLPLHLKPIYDEIKESDQTTPPSLQFSPYSHALTFSKETVTPAVKFLLNEKYYTFDRAALTRYSPFFKERLSAVDLTSTPSAPTEPVFVPLSLPAEEQERLGNLFEAINRKKIPQDLVELGNLYATATVYGLEPLLRTNALQGLATNNYYSLLLHADDLGWNELKQELIAKIILLLSIKNTDFYDYVVDPFHLRNLYTYADQFFQDVLKNALVEHFIEAFKYLLDDYKKFSAFSLADVEVLLSRYVDLEILIQNLAELEVLTLQQEVQIKVNDDVENPQKFRALYEGCRINHHPNMLGRAIYKALEGPDAESVLSRAYSLTDPMPAALHHFFSQRKK